MNYGLGLIPCTPEQRNLCGASPFASLPESEWVNLSRRSQFGPDTITNQKQTSACVGYATAGATSKLRAIRGQPFVKLSGPFIYSLINGGSDSGANIGSALKAVSQFGAPPLADCDLPNIYRRQTKEFDAEAAKNRVDLGVRIESLEEAATLLLRGGVLVFAVRVGRNFGRLDSDGAAGFDRGTSNHAVHADGIIQHPRHGWCLEGVNSWSQSWGDHGRFLWPLKYFAATGYQDAFGVCGTLVDTSLTGNNPPKPIV
jgi:hypothetical protein